MGETTSRVTDAATGILIREVTTGASPGVQQVISVADAVSGVLAQIRSTGALDINVASAAGNIPVTSGSLTGSGVSVAAATTSAGNLGILIFGGTYTGLPIIFEATVDGTNWFPITAVRSDRNAPNSSCTLNSAGIYFWRAECGTYIQVRVRQTAAATTQTANPTVVIAQGASLYDPTPVNTEAQPDTATVYSIASSTTSTTLLNGNTRRRAAFVYNDSTSVLYVALGVTASLTYYTVQVPPSGLYEIPFPAWTGTVNGFWVTANGSAKVTELYNN